MSSKTLQVNYLEFLFLKNLCLKFDCIVGMLYDCKPAGLTVRVTDPASTL